jgi:hypothetical protein
LQHTHDSGNYKPFVSRAVNRSRPSLLLLGWRNPSYIRFLHLIHLVPLLAFSVVHFHLDLPGTLGQERHEAKWSRTTNLDLCLASTKVQR